MRKSLLSQAAILGILTVVGIAVCGVLAPGVASGAPSPLATQDPVTYDGIAPSVVSLSWAHTGDVFFSSYVLQEATAGSNGPWTTVWSTTNSGTTSVCVTGLGPLATEWFQIVDHDSFGTATSNQLQVSQPPVSSLSHTLPTPTSAQFSWTDSAAYGGSLSFVSYTLYESINGGAFTSVTTITAQGTGSYTVQGLSSGTSYSFKLQTADSCGGSNVISTSNVVSFNTPLPLTAAASASPATAVTGQTVTFTCSASGGVTPYTYEWAFGDGAHGSGNPATHTYSSSGTFDASCTITDGSGAQQTAPAAVTVTSSNSNGNPSGGNPPSSSGTNSPSGGGVPTSYIVIVIVAVLAVVAVLVAIVIRGRRSKTR